MIGFKYMTKYLAWFTKHKKVFSFFVFIIILLLNIYLRLFPAYFPQLRKQAEYNIRNNIVKDVIKEVDKNYPDFNVVIRNKLVKLLTDEQLKNKDELNKKIMEEYKKLKGHFQDETGQTYLMESDPYHWMRWVENIIKNGHPGDVIKKGKSYDNYILAPNGCELLPCRFFFYLSAYLYKIFAFFFKGFPLVKFLFYLPVFYTTIFLILVYLFVKYSFSEATALIALFYIGFNPSFLPKSCAGWFDHDVFSIGIPLIIVFLINLGLKNKNSLRKLIFYTLLASLFMGIYSFTWIAFPWIFGIVGLYIGFEFLNRYFIAQKLNKEMMGYLIAGILFSVCSIAFCYLISGINLIEYLWYFLTNKLGLGTARNVSIFPNTYYTVSELLGSSLDALSITYGRVFFMVALIGALWAYIKQRRADGKDILVILIFWMLFMTYLSLKSIRFTTFLLIPLGIFLGIFIEQVFHLLRNNISSLKTKLIYISVFFVILLWGGQLYLLRIFESARSIYPLMNDSWNKVLAYIKDKTPQDAIINTWWDYGNYFETIAERRVIFDPQTQNNPLAYWMGRVFLSSNEEEIIKILRMINNSSYTLFDDMNKYFKDEFKTIALLNKLIDSNLAEAENILDKYKLSPELKKEIIDALFEKEPAPAYFMVDRHLIDIIPAVSFLGSWDFKKAYIIRNIKMPKDDLINNMMELFSLSKSRAELIYTEVSLADNNKELDQIASKPLSFSFGIKEGQEDNNLIYFNNSIVTDMSNQTARIYLHNAGGFKKFRYFYICEGDKYSVKESNETDYEEGCLAVKDGEKWKSVGLSKELGDALITRLYFMKGHGLKYFEPFYSDDEKGVYVYRIKWHG